MTGLKTVYILHENYENLLTEAQPQPDFLPGLTSFLQFIAHADGELKTWFALWHFIVPSQFKPPMKLRP